MKRQLLKTATTLVNARRGHRSSGRRLSVWRKTIVVALSLTLVLVPLLSGRTITPPAQAQIICGGTDPNRVFQGCPLGGPFEVSLENQALDDLLNAHQLPATDRSRLLGWQRDELRSLIYDKLLGVIKKADEQAAVNAFAARIKQRRVDAAQYAVDEYNRWVSSPCTYTPPDGFTYPGRQLCAAARLNPAVAGPIDPPKFEEFQAYGVARAYEVFQDLKAQKTMDQVVRCTAFFGSLAVGSVAGAVVAAHVSRAALKAIFPYAGRLAADLGSTVGKGAGAASNVAAGVGRVLGIAVPVLIIVGAIVTGVLRGIDVFNIEAIPGKLQAKLAEAQNAPLPDLAQLITTDSGQQEVFGAYILLTLPDYPSTDAVPAPQDSDPRFRVRQNGSSTITTPGQINFKTANTADGESINQSVRLNGGWFINKYKDRNNVEKERWKLRIDYFNWAGELWSAGRAGANFVHVKLDDPSQSFTSPEINYLDWDGNKYTASLLLSSLSIEALPVVLDRGHREPGVNVIAPQTLPVALVNSGGQAPNTLSVEVNNGTSATVTGVTLSDLSVDSNGRVTASLKAECTAIAPTFTLKVTDSVGQSKTVPLAIQLSPIANNTFNPLESALPDGAIGVPYNGLVSGIFILAGFCNVSDLGLSVTSGKLPPGLSLGRVEVCDNPPPPTIPICTILGYGVIGTPTSGGRYEFTVRNSYNNGDHFSRTYTVNIDSRPAPLPSDALSWWSGERGILDDLERSHGRLNNGFNNANFAPGKVGLAFSFNGSFGSVQLPNNFFPFAPAGNSPFTFETWFKTGSGGIIFGRQDTDPWGLLPFNYSPGIYVGNDGRLRAQMFWNGTKNPVTSQNAVNDNDFHHVAVIYDGTQQIVYLDGAEMGRATYTQAGANVSYKYQLGTGYALGWPSALSLSPWFGFNGLIDEPTMYNRPLTPQEVQSIYAAGSAGKIHINVTTADPYCASDNSGVIKVNVLGGAPPFTYGLDHGATVGDFQPEGIFTGSAGDYTVKVKDAEERVFTRSVQLNNPTQSISATSQSFSAQSGTGSFNVTSSAGCGWQAVSDNPDFITITTPAGGQGSGSGAVNFSVAANNTSTARTGTISIKSSIANHTFTVRQDGPPITATVSGGGTICPGGSATVSVNLTNGVAPYTVTLTNGGGTKMSSSLPITFTVSPTVTTTYAVESATDGFGSPATANGSATVTVGDSSAPTLTLKPDLSLWPPNNRYQTVTMSQMVQSVTDNCSTLSVNDVVIEKVTSDEPDNAPGDADGNTTGDIVIAADCKSVQLRAERDETKNGRVYVATLRMRDAAGNTTRKDFKVSVPIGQNGAPAAQGAAAETKTSSCQ
jgi:Concanavalin A-like lectin/glucanases superfamily/Viral BACON domain